MTLDLLRQIVGHAESGEAVMVCACATRGSTPQKAGARMLVTPGGATSGTIGGGCVEAEVRSRALRRLVTEPEADAGDPTAALMTFRLDRDYDWDDGLICGGTMDVVLQRIQRPTIESEASAAWGRAAAEIAAGRPAEVRIPARAETDAGTADLRFVDLSFEPAAELIIAGAGHVGAALAVMASSAGFDVTVLDDRTDVLASPAFDGCVRRSGEIDRSLADLPLGPTSFVVIVTRGHRHDGQALRAAIRRPARYVGLIGSRRKILAIYGALREEGVPSDVLETVRAPIGLRIGAVTPQEIAVSILAELIAVRRGEALGAATTMALTPGQLDRLGRGS